MRLNFLPLRGIEKRALCVLNNGRELRQKREAGRPDDVKSIAVAERGRKRKLGRLFCTLAPGQINCHSLTLYYGERDLVEREPFLGRIQRSVLFPIERRSSK